MKRLWRLEHQNKNNKKTCLIAFKKEYTMTLYSATSVLIFFLTKRPSHWYPTAFSIGCANIFHIFIFIGVGVSKNIFSALTIRLIMIIKFSYMPNLKILAFIRDWSMTDRTDRQRSFIKEFLFLKETLKIN